VARGPALTALPRATAAPPDHARAVQTGKLLHLRQEVAPPGTGGLLLARPHLFEILSTRIDGQRILGQHRALR
jgi:hypothetical protein